MKDLVTDIIRAQATGATGGSSGDGSSSGGAAGSLFNTAIPSVLDVRHRLVRCVGVFEFVSVHDVHYLQVMH